MLSCYHFSEPPEELTQYFPILTHLMTLKIMGNGKDMWPGFCPRECLLSGVVDLHGTLAESLHIHIQQSPQDKFMNANRLQHPLERCPAEAIGQGSSLYRRSIVYGLSIYSHGWGIHVSLSIGRTAVVGFSLLVPCVSSPDLSLTSHASSDLAFYRMLAPGFPRRLHRFL